MILSTYKKPDVGSPPGATILSCKFCTGVLQNIGNTSKISTSKHLICRCGAHFYTPIISFLENKYHPPKWYTAEEWSKTYLE